MPDLSSLSSYVYNPSAYGSIPSIPRTTTNTATTTRTPNLPQYPALSAQASRLAGTQMAGQIPFQDLNTITNKAAERGIMTGSPLSPNAMTNELLRYYGGISGLEQQGMGNYLNLLQSAPSTTTQSQTTDQSLLQAAYAAAPQPYAAGMANLGAQQLGLGQGLGAIGSPSRGGKPNQPESQGTGTAGMDFDTWWQQQNPDWYSVPQSASGAADPFAGFATSQFGAGQHGMSYFSDDLYGMPPYDTGQTPAQETGLYPSDMYGLPTFASPENPLATAGG